MAGLENVMREIGLKSARQGYRWNVVGEEVKGTNVYGMLTGPRADATEAMVLIAAWRNFEGKLNYSGVALALSLMRYFKRWSIWSKDILLLIPEDSVYGPEAWVSAYHSTAPDTTASRNISSLPIKAGALQGAIALDYPAGPWGQRFDKLDIVYDGINGALPNLDLLNTAVSVASSQMGIGCTLHGLTSHKDSYTDRLTTISRGLLTQSVGHATGPHSAFMPYHVDAITLKTVGDGWHDEMSLGRTAESLMRSINNLLEHLHQSFFFYILLNTHRFVSIGNYLPAAMILAGGMTITALALWVQSGRAPATGEDEEKKEVHGKLGKKEKVQLEVVKEGGDVALVPKAAVQTRERKMFLPAVVVLGVHLAGLVPLYLLNHLPSSVCLSNTTQTIQPIANHSYLSDSPHSLHNSHSPHPPHPRLPLPPPHHQHGPQPLIPGPNPPAQPHPPPSRRHSLHARDPQLQPRIPPRPAHLSTFLHPTAPVPLHHSRRGKLPDERRPQRVSAEFGDRAPGERAVRRDFPACGYSSGEGRDGVGVGGLAEGDGEGAGCAGCLDGFGGLGGVVAWVGFGGLCVGVWGV